MLLLQAKKKKGRWWVRLQKKYSLFITCFEESRCLAGEMLLRVATTLNTPLGGGYKGTCQASMCFICMIWYLQGVCISLSLLLYYGLHILFDAIRPPRSEARCLCWLFCGILPVLLGVLIFWKVGALRFFVFFCRFGVAGYPGEKRQQVFCMIADSLRSGMHPFQLPDPDAPVCGLLNLKWYDHLVHSSK